MSPFPIAGGIFGVNNRVGDNVGFYIGMANGKPVFLNMTQACRENKSPAATFFGYLGFGKSFNVNDYTYLHVINGGRAVVIDPKGERTHWRSMPLIGKHVNVAELTSDAKNKGLIALSGNTGNSTGPHLHFEVVVNGTPKNPRSYLS